MPGIFLWLTSPYPQIAAGRDQGVMIYKEYGGGKFKWAYGAFEGRKNASNADANPDENDNFQHGFRATYNFWTPEPGYYTTSAYYGAKDVLAVAFVARYEDRRRRYRCNQCHPGRLLWLECRYSYGEKTLKRCGR